MKKFGVLKVEKMKPGKLRTTLGTLGTLGTPNF
jgi:hypothetical protein